MDMTNGMAAREKTHEEMVDCCTELRQRAEGLAMLAAEERHRRARAEQEKTLAERILRECGVAAKGGRMRIAYYSDEVRLVVGLKEAVESAKDRATALEGALEDNERKVADLEGKMGILEGELARANSRLVVADQTLAEMKARAKRSGKR